MCDIIQINVIASLYDILTESFSSGLAALNVYLCFHKTHSLSFNTLCDAKIKIICTNYKIKIYLTQKEKHSPAKSSKLNNTLIRKKNGYNSTNTPL